MAPPILFLKDAHLTFGGTPLLEGADISVEANSRIGLVGRNGSGKSTLLKILGGLVEKDAGERFSQPDVTIRYLPQEPDFSIHKTVGSYVAEGLEAGDDLHRGQYLLNELGLSEEEPTENLSGGEARRAALARTLAPEPDVLLLDEPTNHLDLPAIEWLESELARIQSAYVLISHDRRFLENLTRQTVWIDRGNTRTLERGFGHFEKWRDEVLEQEALDLHKLDRKIVREQHWIVHGVSGRRKRNMRRVRELADLRLQRKETKLPSGDVILSSADADNSGKLVAKIDQISKSYADRPIIQNFSTIIRRGDRIGIIGPNGSGKTTLINLITGKLQPDGGTIKLGVNLDTLVIDQKREALKNGWSLKEALTDGAGDMVSIGEETKHVMTYMKDFLFTAEQANTPIHALSGGERGRLMLARGLRNPSNLLVLDEPTNDLDIETLDLLQEFIHEYRGTVILVSHDRDFLDRTCSSVIAFEGEGRWLEYAGGYSDMLLQRGHNSSVSKTKIKSRPNESAQNNKLQTDVTSAKAKLSFNQKHALDTLPREIDRLQFEITKLNSALEAPDLFAREPKKFKQLAAALTERQKSLSKKEEEWLELELLREEVDAQTQFARSNLDEAGR